MGGSLRNPASFCGVVGLRPSLGRVPEWPLYNQWETTSVGGPMARNVGDLALLLSVMAGPDPRAPQALGDPGATFAPPLSGSLAGLRVALSRRPRRCLRGRPRGGRRRRGRRPRSFTAAGRLRRHGAPRPHRGRRHLPHAARLAPPGQARPTARRAPDVVQAVARRQHPPRRDADRRRRRPRLHAAHRARRSGCATSSTSYDVLVLPVSQVPPFPADQEFPTAINGRPMETYLDWMRSAYFITVTGCPADLGPGRHHRLPASRSASRSSPPTAPTGGCSRSRRPWRPLACRDATPVGRAASAGERVETP